ncbi:gamma-soluble NSF attachment protein-like, partial [Culicoides brevitarsis]|uniref:gamma-soluble NSF attachment protein-like n=1 Tax=Culicoides brevitarsis TaxID=469753 RepID=UPI00307CC6BD
VCFRTAKAYDQCKYCLLKSADCHKQARSLFHSAKCLDQAILICKEMNSFSDIRMLAERACNLYQQHGSPESGASTLEKAARILEDPMPDQALALYQRAVEVTAVEDTSRQSTEYASKVARLMVKLGMYDQACDAIRREIGLYQQTENIGLIGRLAVALVLVQLAREDVVAAEKAFKEWGNCCDPAEVQTLEQLLQAYDDEDPDSARQALRSPFIRHMDIEYARLANELKLPRGAVAAPKANVIENAAASYVSPNAAGGGDAEAQTSGSGGLDDIEEGGLC